MLPGLPALSMGSLSLSGFILAVGLEGVGLAGAVVGLLLAVSALVGVIYGVRFRVVAEAASAEARAYAGNTAAERERADRLERELKDAMSRESELLDHVRKLEQMPDMTTIAERLTQIELRLSKERLNG